MIGSKLTVGIDVTSVVPLRSNEALSSQGVKLHGSGFVVTAAQAHWLGWDPGRHGTVPIFPYQIGRDLNQRSRGVMVIDAYGLKEADLRMRHPAIYQWLLERVKPERDGIAASSSSRDSAEYAERWWLFGKPRPELRAVLVGLDRYIGTAHTSEHRMFQFLDRTIIPESMIVAIALDDAFFIGALSSRIHVTWAIAAGGRLGAGNDPRYNKTRCFDPFPFPDPEEPLRASIRALGEELDAHRKARQADHPDLTMTGMYNVLAKLRSGEALTAKEMDIHARGLVSVLKDIHDRLDGAVADAYGWPRDLDEEAILERLVALNRERAEEERRGHVRWLRPDYQAPRAKLKPVQEKLDVAEPEAAAAAVVWPASQPERFVALRQLLEKVARPVAASDVARTFKGAKKAEVEPMLQSLAAMGLARPTSDGRYAA